MEKIIVSIISLIIGLCIGSFLNVVIYRLPNNMNLAFPNSHCPKCKNKIKWYDNIPVLSYIFLLGKCRNCKEKISIRYLIVELLNALLYSLCVFCFYDKNILYMIMAMIICSVMIIITFIDLEHMIIPDSMHLILITCSLVMFFCEIDKNNLWYSKLIASILVGGIFFLIMCGYERILKKEALGAGDVKFMFVVGLFLGLSNTILAVIIASVFASIVLIIIKLVKKYGKDKEYPFAPFLCFGVLIALFFGAKIVESYLSLFV